MEEWLPDGEADVKAARRRKLIQFEPHEWLVDGGPGTPENGASGNGRPPNTTTAQPAAETERPAGNGTRPALRQLPHTARQAEGAVRKPPQTAFAKRAEEVEQRMRLIEERVELATASIRELSRRPRSNDRG